MEPEDGVGPAVPAGEALFHQRRGHPVGPGDILGPTADLRHRGAGTPPRRSASSRRPLPWRSDPAKALCLAPPGWPATGPRRMTTGAPPGALAAERARPVGARPCTPSRPRSNIVWLNSHEPPGGTRRSPSAKAAGPVRRRSGNAAREHPHPVGVDGRHVVAEAEGPHRPRRVGADAGEGPQRGLVSRHRPPCARTGDGCPVQVEGTAVIAESRPEAHHLGRPGRGAGGRASGRPRRSARSAARPGPPGSAAASPRRRGTAKGRGCGATAGRAGARRPSRAAAAPKRRARSAGSGRPQSQTSSP